MRKKKRSKIPKQKDATALYRKIWALADGAVEDAFRHHPNYLTPAGQKAARLSIVKRVAGAITGYVEQCSAQGRSGKPAADKAGTGITR